MKELGGINYKTKKLMLIDKLREGNIGFVERGIKNFRCYLCGDNKYEKMRMLIDPEMINGEVIKESKYPIDTSCYEVYKR